MTSDHSAFVVLVLKLRAEGAVRVRDGSLEVAFAGPPMPVLEAPPDEQSTLTERQREHYHQLLQMAEEIA